LPTSISRRAGTVVALSLVLALALCASAFATGAVYFDTYYSSAQTYPGPLEPINFNEAVPDAGYSNLTCAGAEDTSGVFVGSWACQSNPYSSHTYCGCANRYGLAHNHDTYTAHMFGDEEW
jgi:hypothetical protein